MGTLDEGCDALLFYGLIVTERIDFRDGTAILPYGEVRRFVNQELVEELAPEGAGFHSWRPVGAIVRPFRWRPVFRRSGSVNAPLTASPEPFFREAGMLLDLIAVSHAAPVLPLAAISDCIDRSGGRLLGRERHGPGMYRKWPADGFDGFAECPVLKQSALDEAREAFEGRGSARFERFAPFAGRLAEALGRHGRFAGEVRTVDVADCSGRHVRAAEVGKVSEAGEQGVGLSLPPMRESGRECGSASCGSTKRARKSFIAGRNARLRSGMERPS